MSDSDDTRKDRIFQLYHDQLTTLAKAYRNVSEAERKLRAVFGVNWETMYETWMRENDISTPVWY